MCIKFYGSYKGLHDRIRTHYHIWIDIAENRLLMHKALFSCLFRNENIFKWNFVVTFYYSWNAFEILCLMHVLSSLLDFYFLLNNRLIIYLLPKLLKENYSNRFLSFRKKKVLQYHLFSIRSHKHYFPLKW